MSKPYEDYQLECARLSEINDELLKALKIANSGCRCPNSGMRVCGKCSEKIDATIARAEGKE